MLRRRLWRRRAKKQEHSLIAPPSEDDLIVKMENVVLHSDLKQKAVVSGYGHKQNGGLECSESLPLRPVRRRLPSFTSRTGACKFGLSCRYNHPVKRTRQFIKGRDYDTEYPGMIECKYSIAGVCKNVKSCRYRHPGEVSENAFRRAKLYGERRSVRTTCAKGSCGYGSLCVYHHPDPTFNDKQFDFQTITIVILTHLTGASQPDQASWSLHKFPNSGGSFSENFTPYEPVHSFSPWMVKQPEWNGYQNSSYSHQSLTSASGSDSKPDITVQVEEFPERPGQPECCYFMVTGNCKSKFTCRYHHPKNRMPKQEEYVLNENGLPLRPGKNICRDYERIGLCKFGRACQYDHPASRGLVSRRSAANADLPVSSATVVGSGDGRLG
ncbi:hypothetical protein ACJIZ3_015116 [Penstemon smallii]|uniref:C3H1-type domain-containing protein n=1 Tax=Penstemon smallii TaxID=265156 RepID=A0ABD3RLR4_9LAMI